MAQFKCITAKGVNYTKNYLGEGVINYQDIRTTSLEIVFNNVDNTEELSKYLEDIEVYDEIGRYGNFSVEELSFTNSRITNAEFPTSDDLTETGIGFGKIILTIETRSVGDTSYLENHAYYDQAGNLLVDQIETYGHIIENLSEDFTFMSGVGDQLQYSRSINLQLIDTTNNSLALAKTVAGNILDTAPNFGFAIENGLPGSLKTYKSETVNKITNEISITQKYSLLVETSTLGTGESYTYELTHRITGSEEGLINVSEAGTILGTANDEDIFLIAREAVKDLLASSYDRCLAVYQNVVLAEIQANVILNIRPIDTSRTFDNVGKQASYTISYTADPSLHNGYVADRTITSSEDSQGLRIMAENTTLTTFDTRGLDPIVFYTTDKAGAYSRINDMLNQGSINVVEGMVNTNNSVDYDPVGKVVTYNIEYKNSPPLVTAQNIDSINRIETSINDTSPIRMHSEYPIAGYKFLVHKGGQTELGKRTITISAIETRPEGVWPNGIAYASNRIINPDGDLQLTSTLKTLCSIAKEKALDIFTDLQLEENDLFVSSCKWGYDSKGNVSFDIEITFAGMK